MRRRAVAPVKIDPPHSFPTFPLERFATMKGWGYGGGGGRG